MFSRLAELIEDSEAEISEELKQAILSHLKALKVEFEKYFPNLNASDFTPVRNPPSWSTLVIAFQTTTMEHKSSL